MLLIVFEIIASCKQQLAGMGADAFGLDFDDSMITATC